MKALISGGCELNLKDGYDRSAVYWAAQEGHMDVLEVKPCLLCPMVAKVRLESTAAMHTCHLYAYTLHICMAYTSMCTGTTAWTNGKF